MIPASRFKRFIAYLVDGLILSIVTLIIILPIVLVKTTQIEEIEFLMNRYSMMILYPLMLLYYSFFESSKSQASLGKKLLNLYVSDDNAQRVSLSRAFSRCLIWLLPLFPIAFLTVSSKTMEESGAKMSIYWWILPICFILYFIEFIPIFGKERKTLYDIFTSTRVSKRVSE